MPTSQIDAHWDLVRVGAHCFSNQIDHVIVHKKTPVYCVYDSGINLGRGRAHFQWKQWCFKTRTWISPTSEPWPTSKAVKTTAKKKAAMKKAAKKVAKASMTKAVKTTAKKVAKASMKKAPMKKAAKIANVR